MRFGGMFFAVYRAIIRRFSHEYLKHLYVINDLIRSGAIALHLIDGKVVIEVEEALKACEQRKLKPAKSDLFTAA
jgi:hypothetical protein